MAHPDIAVPSPPPSLAWLAALREPERALDWTLGDWNRHVRLARRDRLLARLAEALDRAQLLKQVPEAPRRHLIAEQQVSRCRTAAMLWALERVHASMHTGGSTPLQGPLLLLKGAAYLAQGLPIAAGRLPSDVDILVPREQLDEALARLQADQWAVGDMSAHDLRYYREWSHEAPPMQHPLHPIELDVHHNIRPPVGQGQVDVGRLLALARPCSLEGWFVLDPLDQVLHSAAHLFFDSELRNRLRDLVDLDGLMRHFGGADSTAFFEALIERAKDLAMLEPLALAVHFTTRWLGTPVPPDARAKLTACEPTGLSRLWLLQTLRALLTPADIDAPRASWRQGAAASILLGRYHLGRLPLRILIPHLVRKAWQRRNSQRAA
jgi:hypothetical protein